MEELKQITDRYNPDDVREGLESSLKRFSLVFLKDVAEIYDCLTRLKNVERNPSGFSLEDAPILGLLVRIAKLLKEVLVVDQLVHLVDVADALFGTCAAVLAGAVGEYNQVPPHSLPSHPASANLFPRRLCADSIRRLPQSAVM
jgi:hypothetical protein